MFKKLKPVAYDTAHRIIMTWLTENLHQHLNVKLMLEIQILFTEKLRKMQKENPGSIS